jgi:hypothetical protein
MSWQPWTMAQVALAPLALDDGARPAPEGNISEALGVGEAKRSRRRLLAPGLAAQRRAS